MQRENVNFVFGVSLDTHRSPITIHCEQINQVCSYKYLGVVIDHLLSWKDQIESVCKKTKSENKSKNQFPSPFNPFRPDLRFLKKYYSKITKNKYVAAYCTCTVL